MFIGFTTKKKIAAATVTNAISAFRKSPYRNTLPLIVNVRLLKSGFPKIAAMIGVMMSATNAWTTRPNAAPITTATARSTTFPRIRNALNSASMLLLPVGVARHANIASIATR